MTAGKSSAAAGAARPRPGNREAAVVLLVRSGPETEIYWVRRAPPLAYLGGFHAFPGGRVSGSDEGVPIDGVEDPFERRRRVAAARELFEETGVLLARAGDGGSATALPPGEAARARAELQEGDLRFAEFLERRGLRIAGERFHPAGRWVSPPFSPRGFDTRFYLVAARAGEEPTVIPGELVEGAWIRPADGLAAWRRGEALLATPTREGLRVLVEHAAALEEAARAAGDGAPGEAALAACARDLGADPQARGGAVERIEIVPGAILLPLATPTLPPATHTNCMILGQGECLLVDPGSDAPEALEAIDRMHEEIGREGRRIVAAAVTHRHRDHTGGAAAVRERLRVPLLAHPRLAGEIGADRALRDAEVIELASPDGEPWRIEAHFTPGHTRDHVVFLERHRGVLAAGDLVSGLSTVILDPPEGELGPYLDSVRRVLAMPVRVLFPAHGPPIGGVAAHLQRILRHRSWREERVIAALGGEPRAIAELIPEVYEDVPSEQWEYAERSLLAHLLHLVERGRARRHGEGPKARWSLS